jgi:hypothetical protein
MPLPPALQARLQKRGIVTETGTSVTSSSALHTGGKSFSSGVLGSSFFVFTIGYVPGFAVPITPGTFASPAVGISQHYAAAHELDAKTSWPGCPNKCNPYHVCVDYCRLRWGNGYSEPEKYTEKKRQLMLLKYPKPPGWKEIYDPGT